MTTPPDRPAPGSCGCSSIVRYAAYQHYVDRSACNYPATVEALSASRKALTKAGYDLSECREALKEVRKTIAAFRFSKGHKEAALNVIDRALATEKAK
jgi:hypothetical protein